MKSDKSYKITHNLVGGEVWYRGSIWRVIAAHKSPKQESAWFTLKRELGIEVLAKESELEQVLN